MRWPRVEVAAGGLDLRVTEGLLDVGEAASGGDELRGDGPCCDEWR